MKFFSNEYYGDDVRWFIATVVDNIPPFGLEGRIKISIHGIHSNSVNDIPHRDLPWAQVMMPGNYGSSSGRGVIPRINPGSQVFGVFLDGGSSQLPLILGSLHRTELPTNNQLRNVLIPEKVAEEGEREGRALKYFIDLGYKPHIVATIVGVMNYLTERSFNPTYPLREGYFGVMAWKKDSNRFVSLKAFTDSFSPQFGYNTLEGQMAFVAHELQTTQLVAMGKLKATQTIRSNAEPYRINCRKTIGNGSAATFVYNYLEKKVRLELESEIDLVEQRCVDMLELLNEGS